MKILNNINDLGSFIEKSAENNQKTAFVPTMGALHDGHLALVKAGLERAENVIVSIFVNPTQFAPHEDFDSYPRTTEEDIRKLKKLGAQAVWLPKTEDIYPDGQETDIHMRGVSEPLEGEFRPHFFDGVATVVARLFRAVKPDISLFGEKDFQQLQVIKKMVEDLNLPIEIIGVPIVRDENGLALSSRNAYLNKQEYKIAIQLNEILWALASGDLDEEQARKKILSVGFDKVDYCTKRYSQTLLVDPNKNDRALVAAYIGTIRLIDNMTIKE